MLLVLFAEIRTGVFRPVPLFAGGLNAVTSSALFFGGILGYQRLVCKSLELVRRKDDHWNHVFGVLCVWPYYKYILNHSERRLIRHNQFLALNIGGLFLYGIFIAEDESGGWTI
jgi:hypothetical protein